MLPCCQWDEQFYCFASPKDNFELRELDKRTTSLHFVVSSASDVSSAVQLELNGDNTISSSFWQAELMSSQRQTQLLLMRCMLGRGGTHPSAPHSPEQPILRLSVYKDMQIRTIQFTCTQSQVWILGKER